MSNIVDVPCPIVRNVAPSADRLNWLRAGILGANDGIVSVAAVVVGVAGANASVGAIAAAGAAALVGGAISMALGEYVSVSGQRDAQRSGRPDPEAPDATISTPAMIAKYREWGVDATVVDSLAAELARPEILTRQAVETEDDEVSPWRAAWVSAVTFTVGALLPFIAILLAPHDIRVAVTVVAVLVALAITGSTGAALGGAPRGRATARVLIGGAIALAATYAAGAALGTHSF
jgi:VIT1/CCC1 family predicted Fe2+/Mn2+ transporter